LKKSKEKNNTKKGEAMQTFLIVLAVIVAILATHSAIAAKKEKSKQDKPEKK